MKFFILLLCITLSVAFVPAPQPSALISDKPAELLTNVAPVPPQATLAQDIQDLGLLIPKRQLNELLLRNLINNLEFQGVLRSINSFPAAIAVRRFSQQPEVKAFRTKLRLSTPLGSNLNLFSLENFNLFNKSPYWANSVYGWQGFINEFMIIYPEYDIQQAIQTKQLHSPQFAQFWRQLEGLRPVFDQFLLYPETQETIIQLQEFGVDTLQLETIIRTQLGWVAPPPVIAPAVEIVPVEPVVV